MGQQQFEIPEKLITGSVIEWIPKALGGGQAWIKFYGINGEVISQQPVRNGYPGDIFDFVAMAQNIANNHGLIIKGQSPDCQDNTSVRCLLV